MGSTCTITDCHLTVFATVDDATPQSRWKQIVQRNQRENVWIEHILQREKHVSSSRVDTILTLRPGQLSDFWYVIEHINTPTLQQINTSQHQLVNASTHCFWIRARKCLLIRHRFSSLKNYSTGRAIQWNQEDCRTLFLKDQNILHSRNCFDSSQIWQALRDFKCPPAYTKWPVEQFFNELKRRV